MAKKGVVIFDGEDMFINPKKAIYSKTRGEAKKASFVSARGDDGLEEVQEPMGRERIVRDAETTGGGGATPIAQPTPIVTEPQPSVIQQTQSQSKKTGVEPDTPITVSIPRAEVPTIVVPPILPPDYIAPVPTPPKRPTPPERVDPISGIKYKGEEPEPGATPIYTIDDGTPVKSIIDTPRYVAPEPELPPAPVPPPAIVIPDPLDGGGSPVLNKDPEIPKMDCPPGFFFNTVTGTCYPIADGGGLPDETPPKDEVDPCATPPSTPLIANHEWRKTGPCTWEMLPKKVDITTSTTTTTTTKKVDKVDETTTTSTTTTTTTKKSVNCNPPVYAPPKYYKWLDKGNCTFELGIDETQIKDPAPTPPLPPVNGQPIININYPGGLGTLPPATTPLSTEELPTGDTAGGGGGGGGGTPFPEEPAPIIEEPKKNYFWWYVGGALAVYLLIKRKKK